MRFALFGAGFIGKVHGDNLVRHPKADLIYVYDVNSDAAQQAAARFNCKAAVSPEEIWQDDTIDAVVIASSTNTHAALLAEAAVAKKAVLCEKPIDLDLARVKDVVTQVKQAGIPVALGFSRRFDESHQALYQAVRAGEIGRLELLQLTNRGPTPPPVSYIRVSGGQLRDQTIHFFDLARWIAQDEVTTVYARGACLVDPAIGEAGDIDTSVAVLTFASGAIATIDSSRRTAYGYDERAEAFGSDGLVVSERKPTAHVSHFARGKTFHQPMYAGWFERMEPTFFAELDAFITALERNTSPSPSLVDGLKAQLIAEAAVRSLSSARAEVVEVWEPQ